MIYECSEQLPRIRFPDFPIENEKSTKKELLFCLSKYLRQMLMCRFPSSPVLMLNVFEHISQNKSIVFFENFKKFFLPTKKAPRK